MYTKKISTARFFYFLPAVKEQPGHRPRSLNCFWKVKTQAGFTLLELVIVLFILGLMSAMAWSSLGVLDNDQRQKNTIATMEMIRDAIMGPKGIYDGAGRRVIGGYVGDMKKFPDLWEARAEVKPSFTGATWPSPAPGMGQGPEFAMDPNKVFFRPSGKFASGRWQWLTPYRKLTNDTDVNADHIGGLETENEGQPRGLWTYYPEELSVDLPGHPAPGFTEGENWKGPYVNAPLNQAWQAGEHYAKSPAQYQALSPAWSNADGRETWEDGDYGAALGETFDDKEKFRLLKTHQRFEDGWGRALRFFITQDPDRSGSSIFWIVSEGPDYEGRYPTKGACIGQAWSVDANDTMGKNYDQTLAENQDNIVIKIYSREYETVFEQAEQDKEARTFRILQTVRTALAGDAPNGLNTGYTGTLLCLPSLFQWETDHWDDADGSGTPYTKGQPRGLWTAAPNSKDSGDNLAPSVWGVGWSAAYMAPPLGTGENEVLTDAWGRALLFFYDATDNAMMVLSRGRDGRFNFGNPENLTETLDMDTYDASLEENQDNLVIRLRNYAHSTGFLTAGNITVLNATAGITKARLFIDGTLASDQIDTCTSLTDEDGDTILDDWSFGAWPGNPWIDYGSTSSTTLGTGARYLVVWNDADADNEIDSGEEFKAVVFKVLALAGTGQIEKIRMDAANFQPY